MAFLSVGLALLAGLGLVRTPAASLRYAGLAVFLGWVATAVAVSLMLVAGVELTVATVVVFWALLAGVSLAVATRVAPRRETVASEPSYAGRVAAFNAGWLLVLLLAASFLRVRASGSLYSDAWGFWLPRAKTIFETGRLDTTLGGYTTFIHPEYPPLAPASDAVAFRFMGREDVLLLPLQRWVLFVAFLAALAGLLAGRVRPGFLWPALASIALLPRLDLLVGSLLADELVAELFALAGVCAGLWLLDRDWRYAAVCGVLLAALTMTKNEGLMLGLALVAALALATALRPWRTILPLAAVVVLAAVPWRVWHAANDVRDDSDYRLGDLFDPDVLGERIDRLGIAVREFPQYVLDPGRWLFSVPIALVLAALLARRLPTLAVLCAGTLLAAFAGYLAVYWIGFPEISFYLDSTAERLAAHLVLFAAALAPLLAQEALSRSP